MGAAAVAALIGPIVSAAGSLIGEVIELARNGREDEAKAKVARFVAATKAELSADTAEALDILEARDIPED